MKKFLTFLCLAGMLTGCGVVDEPETSLSEAATKSEASTESETTTATETATISDKTEPIQAETQSSLRERVIAEYKSALQARDFVISYTLYDMDKDKIPELIIKYGTSEADFQIAIYSYKDGKLKEIANNIGGSHTSFAYDYVTDQFVLAMGHMGYGYMSWYDIDENFELRSLTQTDVFGYSNDEGSTYGDHMKQYNVAPLDSSVFFQSDSEKKTLVNRHYSGELQTEEYKGFDYTFLEDYQF